MAPATNPRSKGFTFTLNNYTNGHQDSLLALGATPFVQYLVFGREVAPTTGTPHLQGYIEFTNRRVFRSAVAVLPEGCHVERARDPSRAAEYCKKDGDYEEVGTPTASNQGKRTDLDAFTEWVASQGVRPSQREIIRQWPNIFARCRSSIWDIVDAFRPIAEFNTEDLVLRDWQQTLSDRLDGPPEERKVIFIVDYVGASGKSFFCRYAIGTKQRVQLLRPGKRDDVAMAIDETALTFLFDVPRSQMETLQYSILEQLKDCFVMSNKYQSRVKRIESTPHVVVFCNEQPDMNALSIDRYEVIVVE